MSQNHIPLEEIATLPKKCYIAGKIGDLPEAVYKAKFNTGKLEVMALGYLPISPTDLPHNHGRKWCDYMREDIRALMECEAIYVLDNFETSRGAKIEIGLAIELGLKTIYQSNRHTAEFVKNILQTEKQQQ